MKQLIRGFLLKVGRAMPRSVRLLGYDVGAPLLEGAILDTRCVPSLKWSLDNMARLGFRPERILDIGAFMGEWTRIAHECFPAAKIHMIEAQAIKEPIIAKLGQEIGATYSINLLGPEAGKTVKFYEMESGSSVLPELSTFARVERTLTTTTLDDVVAKLGWPSADFLKLDVQGFELEVLAGGAKTLKTAQAVLLEVSVVPVNVGAPLIGDVIQFMRERGFVFYDVCTIFRRPLDAALIQLDVIFVKADHALVKNHELNKVNGTP